MERLASLASESPLAWLEPTFDWPSDRVDQLRFMAETGNPSGRRRRCRVELPLPTHCDQV